VFVWGGIGTNVPVSLSDSRVVSVVMPLGKNGVDVDGGLELCYGEQELMLQVDDSGVDMPIVRQQVKLTLLSNKEGRHHGGVLLLASLEDSKAITINETATGVFTHTFVGAGCYSLVYLKTPGVGIEDAETATKIIEQARKIHEANEGLYTCDTSQPPSCFAGSDFVWSILIT
jgi:hypothetical protein